MKIGITIRISINEVGIVSRLTEGYRGRGKYDVLLFGTSGLKQRQTYYKKSDLHNQDARYLMQRPRLWPRYCLFYSQVSSL
jgi:hypothetical protein